MPLPPSSSWLWCWWCRRPRSEPWRRRKRDAAPLRCLAAVPRVSWSWCWCCCVALLLPAAMASPHRLPRCPQCHRRRSWPPRGAHPPLRLLQLVVVVVQCAGRRSPRPRRPREQLQLLAVAAGMRPHCPTEAWQGAPPARLQGRLTRRRPAALWRTGLLLLFLLQQVCGEPAPARGWRRQPHHRPPACSATQWRKPPARTRRRPPACTSLVAAWRRTRRRQRRHHRSQGRQRTTGARAETQTHGTAQRAWRRIQPCSAKRGAQLLVGAGMRSAVS